MLYVGLTDNLARRRQEHGNPADRHETGPIQTEAAARARGIRVVLTTTDTAASGLAPGVDLLLKPYDASSLRAKIGAGVH